MRKSFGKILLGAFAVSLFAVACNNKKEENKRDTPAEDSVKVEQAPPQVTDSTPKSTVDSLDTKPVKPGE